MSRKDIVNEEGQKVDDLSVYCPKCGHHRIQKDRITGQDFDEDGWFHRQFFTCLNSKCGNKWSNKIMIKRGGFKASYT